MIKRIAVLAMLQTIGFAANVTTLRTPDGGIQPQVAVGSDGTAHLIYYKGDAGGGDVFYVRKAPGEEEFSKPIRVNSKEGSAVAAGTIRGAQMALGKNNRAHVVWNGGNGAGKVRVGGRDVTPLLYTRLNNSGGAFEVERNLITAAAGLDGGSSIAADTMGNVYAAWHATIPGRSEDEGEDARAVFVSRSMDEGKTFTPEFQAVQDRTGACGCCGMRAFADASGAVYILYRAAQEKLNRDQVLLISSKPGAPFVIANRHPWKLQTCPMSSAFISASVRDVFTAWETQGQVYAARVNPDTHEVGTATAPPGVGKRKHPVIVSNDKREVLMVWSEDTAWKKGGDVAWQVFDRDLNPISPMKKVPGLPVWSMPAAFAKANGDFVVIY